MNFIDSLFLKSFYNFYLLQKFMRLTFLLIFYLVIRKSIYF